MPLPKAVVIEQMDTEGTVWPSVIRLGRFVANQPCCLQGDGAIHAIPVDRGGPWPPFIRERLRLADKDRVNDRLLIHTVPSCEGPSARVRAPAPLSDPGLPTLAGSPASHRKSRGDARNRKRAPDVRGRPAPRSAAWPRTEARPGGRAH